MSEYRLFIILFVCIFPAIIQAQSLEATETQALLEVNVSSMEGKARAGEIILLEGKKTKKIFKGITDAKGKFKLLIPEGDTYQVQYKTFSGDVKYDEIAIPNEAGSYTYQFTIRYNPAKTFTLKDVFFDTGKASLRPESYKTLNEFVELMKAKPALIVEISGHTDNVGSPESNLTLSLQRANAVKNYLISKGISANRIETKGYGDTQAIDTNTTEEGRQKNRRTEVRIIKE